MRGMAAKAPVRVTWVGTTRQTKRTAVGIASQSGVDLWRLFYRVVAPTPSQTRSNNEIRRKAAASTSFSKAPDTLECDVACGFHSLHTSKQSVTTTANTTRWGVFDFDSLSDDIDVDVVVFHCTRTTNASRIASPTVHVCNSALAPY